MTYEQAFARAVACNAITGSRIKIYRSRWDSSYFTDTYINPLPMPHQWAVLIGEVGRRTPR